MDLIHRPRRLRKNNIIRDLAAETVLDSKKLIMPHFVCEGSKKIEPIGSMPGINRVSIDNLLKDAESDYKMGIRSLLLFGIPDKKDETGSEAYSKNGIVQKAVRELKKNLPGLLIITDVCLCEFTSHGHCGIVSDGEVLNDPTLELLARTALSHAEAGAGMVAPSDMMDGRVLAIRESLDSAGFQDTPVMSYAAKYCSAFYGPFRDAAGSTPQFGDRKSYQMDPRNSIEAGKEVHTDIEEGADIVMVKPALSYLDIIKTVKDMADVPVCAYNVSGEYSMVKAMGKLGYGDEQRLTVEILTSIFRAGADMIITYHARDVVKNKWF